MNSSFIYIYIVLIVVFLCTGSTFTLFAPLCDHGTCTSLKHKEIYACAGGCPCLSYYDSSIILRLLLRSVCTSSACHGPFGDGLHPIRIFLSRGSIVHKQNGAGCCHPAECWPCLFFLCPVLKRRSINWIGENATIKSTPLLCPFKPEYCLFCSTIDCTWMAWLDREPFIPCCQGLGSPCGPVGFATEEDMSYCLCINCNCVYNCLCKPCCGEGLYVLPCENGTCAFTVATRCLKTCACPINLCIADSKTYRAVLIQQVARAQGVELSENQKKLVMKTSTPAANHMSR